MKRIVLILTFSLLVACGNKEVEPGFNAISVDELTEMVEHDDTFLLMVSNNDCYACSIFEEEALPTIEANALIVYEINVAKMNDELIDQLQLIVGNYSSWPVLYYVQNGEIEHDGTYEYSLQPKEWKEWLQTLHLITND